MSKIYIKVIPKSSNNTIVGWRGDNLTIRLNATPERGKANDALIKFLADELDIARDEIRIITGTTDRIKLLELPEESIKNLKDKYGPQ
jgi:hypothetical protein